MTSARIAPYSVLHISRGADIVSGIYKLEDPSNISLTFSMRLHFTARHGGGPDVVAMRGIVVQCFSVPRSQ